MSSTQREGADVLERVLREGVVATTPKLMAPLTETGSQRTLVALILTEHGYPFSWTDGGDLRLKWD